MLTMLQTLFNDIQQGKVSSDQMMEMVNPMFMAEDSMKVVQQCMDKGKDSFGYYLVAGLDFS